LAVVLSALRGFWQIMIALRPWRWGRDLSGARAPAQKRLSCSLWEGFSRNLL